MLLSCRKLFVVGVAVLVLAGFGVSLASMQVSAQSQGGWQRLSYEPIDPVVRAPGEALTSTFQVVLTETARTRYVFVIKDMMRDPMLLDGLKGLVSKLDQPLNFNTFGVVIVHPSGARLACGGFITGTDLMQCRELLAPPVVMQSANLEAGLAKANAILESLPIDDVPTTSVVIVLDDYRDLQIPAVIFDATRADCLRKGGNPLFCDTYGLRNAGALVVSICRRCDEAGLELATLLSGSHYTTSFDSVDTLGDRVVAMKKLPLPSAGGGAILGFAEVVHGRLTGTSFNCGADVRISATCLLQANLFPPTPSEFSIGTLVGGSGFMPPQVVAWVALYVPDPMQPGQTTMVAFFEAGYSAVFLMEAPPPPPPPPFTPRPTATTAPTGTPVPTATSAQVRHFAYLPRLVRAVRPPR